MKKIKFLRCHYCKRSLTLIHFVQIEKGNCICKYCDSFAERLIPKQYDKFQGINYLRNVLEILK